MHTHLDYHIRTLTELASDVLLLRHTGDTDRLISSFKKYFTEMNAYVANESVTSKHINELARKFDLHGTVGLADAFCKLKLCSADKMVAFALVFELAQHLFYRAYYKIAHDLFVVAKLVASESQAVECSLELAKLFEEIGAPHKGIALLEAAMFTGILSTELKKLNSKLKTLSIQIRLNDILPSVERENGNYEQMVCNAIESCISDAKQSIELDNGNANAHYTLGMAYKVAAQYSCDETIIEQKLSNAVSSIVVSLGCCTCMLDKGEYNVEIGKIYDSMRNHSLALDYYNSARDIFGGIPNLPVYLSIVDDLIEQTSARKDGATDNHGFSREVHGLMSSDRMLRLEKRYYENKSIVNTFIKECHQLDKSLSPEICTLQRWNSFTPILSTATAPSTGGGYFISTGYHGIVIDPGFHFIQNFRAAGKIFSEIDYVLITHAHNDHTADLESLLTLQHKYNDEIKGHKFSSKENCIYRKVMRKHPYEKKETINSMVDDIFLHSPRRKRLQIFINPGVKEKCGFLKLNSRDYDLTILNTKQVNYNDTSSKDTLFGGIEIGGFEDNVIVYPIPTRHYDLETERDCFGYVVIFQSERIILWYTGDTGYTEDMGHHFMRIKKMLAHNVGISVEDMSSYEGFILLAHLGGFKPHEQYLYRSNASKAFYDNHLGRLGMCKIIECLKPSVCLVSEFGEEFAGCRKEFADMLHGQYPKTIFLPVDTGLRIMLKDVQGKAQKALVKTSNNDFTQISEIECLEEPNELTNEWSITYNKKGKA